MIRGLFIERLARKPLQTVVCSNCGFLIAKRTPSGHWPQRGGFSNREHCVDCQWLYKRAIAGAHRIIEKLIARGEMDSYIGKSCADCGAPAVCYDMRNYSEPTVVVPVCQRCNGLRGPGILGPKYAAA
jgi:hypothetical protein